MKKISFSEKYGLQQAVLSREKTMTRRTRNSVQPLYSVGEIVAVSQRYKDAGVNFLPEEDEEFGCYGFPAVQDCMKEGIHWWTKDNSLFKYDLGEGFEMFKWRDKPKNPREAFAALIDKISGKGTWENNPEVWVYEFKLD